jgi:hypothetical protein
MTETLNLTIGARALARSVLSIPDQFKSPSDIVRAARLQDILEVEVKPETTEADLLVPSSVEVTKAQVEMLKESVSKNASKLPVSKIVVNLITELGLAD